MLENIRNISGNFINAFSQLVISIAVSKIFSPDLYGEFVYVMAIAFMISVLFNFGYNVFGLVFFSKKYHNILRLLINYSYLSLILIVLVTILTGYAVVALASIYVFLVLLKELFNISLVIDKRISRKIYFNLVDLSLIILVFAYVYFTGVKSMSLLLLFGILLLIKLISFAFLPPGKSISTLKPLPLSNSIRYVRVFFRIVRYNSLNVLFTTVYTQGYFIVIGSLLSFSEVSLVKYLTLIQSNLNIITTSVVQLRNNLFNKVSTKLSELRGLFRSLLVVQLAGAAFSVALIYYFSLFSLFFDYNIKDYFLVIVVMASFTLTPAKQAMGLFLTSKNLFMQRTNAIIISVLLAVPILLLLHYSLYFIALYFIMIDIVSLYLFIKSVAKWRS